MSKSLNLLTRGSKKEMGKFAVGFLVAKSLVSVVFMIVFAILIFTGKFPLLQMVGISDASENTSPTIQDLENKLATQQTGVVLPSEFVSTDTDGNVNVNTKEIITNWSNHPFHTSNVEYFELEQGLLNEIKDAYTQKQITVQEYQDLALESVSIYNQEFFGGKASVNPFNAVHTITFSKDVRVGLLALDYYTTADTEILYHIIAFDAYSGANELQGLSVAEVESKLVAHFSQGI